MENQHKMLSGYRDLSGAEISWINEIKEAGEQVRLLTERLALLDGIDGRWLAIGTTGLQQGFMALVRSVARPQGF